MMQRLTILLCLILVYSGMHGVSFEEQALIYVKRIVSDSPIIIEAGSHHGEDTKRMRTLWPQSTIYAFEPLPQSFKKLTAVAQTITNVYCFNYALSNYTGTTSFYFNPNNDGASSIGKPVAFNEAEFLQTPITVACTTFNDWAHQNSIDHVDFMWLDMEGHELNALKSATHFLHTVKAIYTEIDLQLVRHDTGLYVDLKSFLESQGFCEVMVRTWSDRQGDALFVRKEYVIKTV